MFLKSISFSGFRNLKESSLELFSGTNVFLGKNGQGKTSLLEAIYFLGSGKSFRTSKSQQLINFDCDEAYVSGKVIGTKSNIDTDLRTTLAKNSKGRFLVNDKDTSLANGYLGKLIVTAFVPGDTEIVRGSPSERRKFLDKHLVDIYPQFLSVLLTYQKALKSKLAILDSGEANSSLLDPWDRIISREAFKIYKFRRKFIEELEEQIGLILPLIAPNDGLLKLYLKSSFDYEAASEENFFSQILSQRNKEIATQRSLIGPHRDEVSIELSAHQARDFSSQGQARTITLLLKLAVIELIELKTGESPVITLDDVDSELDETRSKFLFEVFSHKNRQVFISTTSQNLLWPEDTRIFRVEEGQIDLKK